jgi:hypothetical protein
MKMSTRVFVCVGVLIGLTLLSRSFFWPANGPSKEDDRLSTSTAPDNLTSVRDEQRTATSLAQRKGGEEFFAAKIRPVLTASCFKCHGGEKLRGGLRVDSLQSLLKGGDSGPAVVPGDAEESLLIRAIRHANDDLKMPPDKKLSDEIIDDFIAWIRSGADWPDGLALKGTEPSDRTKKPWALMPIKSIQPPADRSGWSANPIDQFVRARLLEKDLLPADDASKRTLIRRVTFDLHGLPPTPAEIDAFVADKSLDAFAKLVDRLLESPRYGERWARHWLDVVRYSDSAGFETDQRYTSAWRYRDYVIQSLNADKPFDRFIQEQVAGDELWPGDKEATIATGLYCVGPAEAESAMTSTQLEYEWLTDSVDTTGAAFLGLTFGCARCHDHKYDPISQRDYYAMQAFFAASDRPFPEKIRILRIKGLNGLLSDAPVPKELMNDPRCTLVAEEKVGSHLLHRQKPMTIRRLQRGELSKPREEVSPAFPEALTATREGSIRVPDDPSARRSALARWLTSPANPLTARVLVNRVWGWHFGQALVRTPNDFGAQGEPPTHLELLDWMAHDFVEHGWSLKRLHRTILMSKTYQMKSIAEGAGLRVDPENRWLCHYPRHRLEGEAIRDAMLACAGSLNDEMFGPPVTPPLSESELTGLFEPKEKWAVNKDSRQHTRRSIYLLNRRTFSYPFFSAFDPPEVMASCPQRMRTIVPTQALALLNSPFAVEQAAAFARRLIKECGDKPDELLTRAWLLAFGRPPTPKELERTSAFLSKSSANLKKDDAHPGARPSEASLSELCLVLLNANEFIYLE